MLTRFDGLEAALSIGPRLTASFGSWGVSEAALRRFRLQAQLGLRTEYLVKLKRASDRNPAIDASGKGTYVGELEDEGEDVDADREAEEAPRT